VTLRDGRRIALVVKWAKEAQKAKFQQKTALISLQVTSAFADQVVVVTELDLDPIEVHNAELRAALDDLLSLVLRVEEPNRSEHCLWMPGQRTHTDRGKALNIVMIWLARRSVSGCSISWAFTIRYAISGSAGRPSSIPTIRKPSGTGLSASAAVTARPAITAPNCATVLPELA
jgi:hypothetical protein